jgi:ribose transport system permease protein
MEVWHVPLPLAILLALVIGSLAGLINGLLIVTSRINGFIITLATASAFTGMSLGLTQAIPFYQLPASFTHFGQAAFGPIPYVGWLCVGRGHLPGCDHHRPHEQWPHPHPG